MVTVLTFIEMPLEFSEGSHYLVFTIRKIVITGSARHADLADLIIGNLHPNVSGNNPKGHSLNNLL